MVKRPKTPETDVTGKFLIIYRAYPNSDCAAVDDKPTLVRWVAEVIHPDHIVSVWTRPQIQSLIMVEVLKDAEHAAFLGQHNWKDFLKDPRPDEMDNVSQVFYSRYSSDRGAQKEGWKLFDVHEEWFKGFRRGQGRIKQPYPETEWCDIPPVTSNVNTNIYCRPIPKAVKPPPPVVKPPVPGSKEYYGAGGLSKAPSGATGQSSSGPSSGSATPLTTEPPTPVNVIPERWPAIGSQATAKKPTPKPALGPSPAANTAVGGGGKKKGVKVGLAEFNAPKKPTGPNSWVKGVPGAAAPKPQGPIVSKDPLPSANPPKERINAWGAAPAPKATTSLTTSVSRSTSVSSQLGATTPTTPNGTTKKSGWGTKSSKWGMKAKEEDAVPAWSSVKSREHSASGSVNHNADAPAGGSAHPWADYDEDDDELPEIPSFKSEPEVKEIEEAKEEEVKEEYDPWAELADEAPATSATPTSTEEDDAEDTWETLGASSAQPSPGLQPQRLENTFDADADDTPGGASWMVQGGKRGRGGANSNNFSNNRGGWGAGAGAGRGQGRGDARGAWAPKPGPDSRGTAWNNRGNGSRGRGGKPNGENRYQGNASSSWNKGKQKASSGEEDQWAADARDSAGNSGSSERSSPAPERVRWAPDVPPHVQGAAEGSSAGSGSSAAQGSLEAYTSTSWSHVEPIAETTEDIYADFANAPRVEFDIQTESPSPEAPSTPAEPEKKKTPKELQEEFDVLYKAHQAAEKKRIEQIICPSHKVVCKKGVCKDIARIIKQENDKIEGKFSPPAHLRHLMRKGGKTRKWNTGAFRNGPSRAQQEGGDGEGDERQRGGGHKAKTVGGYQTEPSHADW